MNHIIEHLVKEYLHRQEALSNIGRFAAEVYVALLLEKAAEYLHDSLGKLLAQAWERLLETWSHVRWEVIPGLEARIKKIGQMARRQR